MSTDHASLSDLRLSPRNSSYPSPVDWREEVIYFLLPDRFSDGKEEKDDRKPLQKDNKPPEAVWPKSWRDWAKSGNGRWQGGTLEGLKSKLKYLSNLGVTAIWIGPVFKQRRHLNTYHGYGIQDFLDVDSHFGTRDDLVKVVEAAHDLHIRVILDVIFNHSGWNWNYDYEKDRLHPRYKA